jgi:outer membrane protein TolC
MKHILIFTLLFCTFTIKAQVIMTLQQCLDAARENNRELQNAALNISIASEQKKEAYTKYYPKISANVLAFQAFDKMIKGDGTIPAEIAILNNNLAQLVGQPYSYSELSRGYNATLSVVEPLYAGGQIHSGNRLAQIQKDVYTLQHSLKEKDVLQKVTENYWKIATVKYNLNTLDAADKQIKAVYDQVDQFVKAGVTTRNDLIKVRLRQQELASNRLKLENAEKILKLLLAQQIGITGKEFDIDTMQLREQNPQAVFVSPEQAVNQREELQLAQKGVEAQEQQIKMERGKNLPTLAIGALGFHYGLGGLSDNIRHHMSTTQTNGMVFGTLSIPISSWWGGNHAIKRMKIKLQQNQNDAQEAREKLAIDIESAWNNLTESYKQIELARTSVEESRENLRIETNQYNAGTESLTELLDAETLYRKTCNLLSEALATYQIRLADYQRKTGKTK